jgi:DNA mismatch endonuclease (patch repair protein)
LPGCPDIVFGKAKVVIFCDGDFWHGRNLDERVTKLRRGHNAPYWIAKIRANVERDRRHQNALEESGWRVLRFWEGDILKDPRAIATRVAVVVRERAGPRPE